MPVGRPTKYKDDMPERVRALLSEGYSKEACAGALGIGVRTLLDWESRYPQFLRAVKEGEAASQKWWEDRGREACANGEFNATVWVMQMKNRFGWKDARESKVSVETQPEQVSELDSWLAAAADGQEKSPFKETGPH